MSLLLIFFVHYVLILSVSLKVPTIRNTLNKNSNFRSCSLETKDVSPRSFRNFKLCAKNDDLLPLNITSTPEIESNVFKSLQTWSNTVSWSNVFTGFVLGSFITCFGIFAPFVYELYSSGNLIFVNDQFSSDVKATSSSSSLSSKVLNEKEMNDAISKSVNLFETILFNLKNGYVDNINPNQLFETAVSSMLKSLDPYTGQLTCIYIFIYYILF